jgi:hypothetical protein
MLVAETLAAYSFSGTAVSYVCIALLAYMVAATVTGLFSMKMGVYYALELRNTQA